MQMLLVLLILIVLAILVVLDVRQKLDLGHPVFVLLTALGYFCSVVWTAALALLALIETLDGGSLLVWVQVALSTLPGTLFGLYVLLRANLTPMHRKKDTPARRAVRLLDDGLIIGLPLQIVVVGGYVLAAVGLHSMFQGPLWMLPFYPLVLAVLWPMLHLVFHVAIVAIVLDPLILLAAVLIGLLWAVQVIFLVHGSIRGCLTAKKSAGSLAAHTLLSFVPVVNLVLAIRLRCTLRKADVSAEEVWI